MQIRDADLRALEQRYRLAVPVRSIGEGGESARQQERQRYRAASSGRACTHELATIVTLQDTTHLARMGQPCLEERDRRAVLRRPQNVCQLARRKIGEVLGIPEG